MMEKEVRKLLIIIGDRVIKGRNPYFIKTYDPETDQKIFEIPGEDKRLVLDPDGALNFFDAVNGPVGV